MNYKHFEDIWLHAEDVNSSSLFENESEIKRILEQGINETTIGELLFAVAGISKTLNFDVAKSMKDSIEKEMDLWE
jgi:hypothetical protein